MPNRSLPAPLSLTASGGECVLGAGWRGYGYWFSAGVPVARR
ncbi:hypothetical protein PRZ61_16275 [Halomonas pacifica]|nr:hypothetical protein [Halomonas pacifica]MDC8805011.1 hypothetical protein [Halomonas pacifica]